MSTLVARLADLPPGTLLGVTLPDGTPVCLGNDGGRVFALHDRCTHAEFSLSSGELVARGHVECIWHGATFDSRTGAVCRGPATEPVATFVVRIEDDQVFVEARSSQPDPASSRTDPPRP